VTCDGSCAVKTVTARDNNGNKDGERHQRKLFKWWWAIGSRVI